MSAHSEIVSQCDGVALSFLDSDTERQINAMVPQMEKGKQRLPPRTEYISPSLDVHGGPRVSVPPVSNSQGVWLLYPGPCILRKDKCM
jgi:hypothetical protein